MDFYIDENLPPKVAHALHALERPDGYNVYSIQETFGKGILDTDLIPKLAEVSGTLITHDFRLLTRKNEFKLLKDCGITVFFVSLPSGCNFALMYQIIIGNWETIKKLYSKEKRPFLCKILQRGKPDILGD